MTGLIIHKLLKHLDDREKIKQNKAIVKTIGPKKYCNKYDSM